MSFKILAKTLRNSLRQRRMDEGMSQTDLDNRLGNAVGLVAKWEGGFRSPTGFSLYCWAKALGCDLVLVPRPEKHDEGSRNRPRTDGRRRNRR
jgi:transcriptional regulator with XRE-family HTH domain